MSDLAKYVRVEESPSGYADATWHAVTEQRARRRRTRQRARRAAVVAGALALAASVLLVVVHEPWRPAIWVGSELATRAEASEVRLSDGSSVRVESFSTLSMPTSTPTDVRLELENGVATFDVTHRPERRFVVVVGDVEVRVVGTRFRVSRDADHDVLSVSVDRGAVELARAGGGEPPVSVRAGERWTGAVHTAPSSATSGRALQIEPPVESIPEPPSPDPVPLVRGSRARPLSDVGGDAAERHLFDAANRARAEGRFVDAIRGYRAVLARSSKGQVASLAALELGRLEVSQKADPVGAARHFEQSLASDPRSPLRGDTIALLVEAYDQSGDLASCARARDLYVREFPSGVHVNRVRKSCAGH